MSRTRKGTKAPGHEPWSARPFNLGGGTPGPYHKRRTARAERAQGRKQAQEGYRD